MFYVMSYKQSDLSLKYIHMVVYVMCGERTKWGYWY